MKELNDLQNLIDELQTTTSTNEKQEILKKYPQCKELLKYTYDPLIQYYVTSKNLIKNTSLPKKELGLSEDIISVLDELSKREVTGHDAIKLVNSFISENGYEKLIHAIIDRDLRIGMSTKLINKVFPNLISYTPYMRCSVANEKTLSKITWPAFSELKSDGTFCNFIVKDNVVTYISRSGNSFDFLGVLDPYFIKLANLFKDNSGTVFNGELLIKENDVIMPREYGNGIIQKFGKGTGTIEEANKIVVRLWDYIPFDSFSKGNEHWECRDIRYKTLQIAIDHLPTMPITLTEAKLVNNFEEALQHYEELVKLGEEGTILKDKNGTWKDGTSLYQLKMKVEVDFDLKVVGFNEGEGKNKGSLGSVVCESSDGLIKVNVSGWKEINGEKDMQRQYIWDNQDKFLGRILVVRSNNLTKDKNTGNLSIYLPRSIEWRNDKVVADSLERIKEIYEMNFMLLKK